MIRPLLVSALIAAAAGETYELPPLPYDKSALKPLISAKTLEIHHGKHHAKYVATLNSMVKGTDLENQPLEKIMKVSYYKKNQALFNNAAQAWNHSFYWKCMKKKGGGLPSGKLSETIETSFGSFAEFRKQFAEAANTAFGSGWAWLICDSKGNLSVVKTIGADNPLVTSPGSVPILTCDVWEHAYYLDYQNMRPTYVDTFLDKLVNWDYVSENLELAMESGQGAEL
jgi:Fe-Mn family superoxide dismutase